MPKKAVNGMRKITVMLCLCGVISTTIFPAENGLPQGEYGKERLFSIKEKILLKGLPKDISSLRIWIPYPVRDNQQGIEDFKIEGPFEEQIITDNKYGNKILFLKAQQPLLNADSAAITLSFKVERKEYGMANAELSSGKDLKPFLKADRFVPVKGEIRKLAQKITKGKNGDIAKARAIYDYIIDELTYSKDDLKICGIGNSLLTLQHKKGICSDYHSLFISLVRSLGIPAKFEIGFRIPADAQEGVLNGYHCWAKFYLKGKGWIPVDASEADKHPEKKDYFFGNIDENKVHLTTGRDIRLNDARDTEPLNFFVYPYVELNGEKFYNVETSISFKEAQ